MSQDTSGRGATTPTSADSAYAPPPGPAGYAPPPGFAQAGLGATGLVGKRRNPFVAWLVLPIVTLTIYHFVWVYRTNKELSRFDSRIEVRPWLSVLAFFPGLFLIVPPFVAMWRLGTRIQRAQRAAGVSEMSPVLSFVLWYFGFGVLYNQSEINKIWDRYPGATQDTAVPLSV